MEHPVDDNDVGFNAKWDVNANFRAELDADRAQSWLNPGGQLSEIDADVGYGQCTNGNCVNTNNVGIALPGGNGLPVPNLVGPGGNSGQFINNGIIGSHVLTMTSNQDYDTVNQIKLQGSWTEDKLQIKFGAQYIMDHDVINSFDDFTNNDWQAYAGYGPASGSSTGVALPQSMFTGSFSTKNFINGYSGNLPANILKFNAYSVLNYLQALGNPQTKTIAGFNGIPAYAGVYQMVENPGAYSDVIENTFAGFLNASFEQDVAGRPLNIHFGVREEFTRLKSYGIGQLPDSLAVQAGDHTAFAVGFGPQSLISGSNSYNDLLPNLDLNYALTNDLHLRFDASRTLSRPPLADLGPALAVGATQRVGALTATGGNPQLMPYQSDNADLSAEYYYLPNSYVSVDGFFKNVTNFVVGGTARQTINNVIDPTTGQPGSFTVTSNFNGPSAEVYGGEFAVQHVFWDTGFGMQANVTVVGTNKPYNPADTTTTGFAVTGLADSANLVAFYDKDGFQARVATNWRGEYLDHFGQHQNNSAFGDEPTFVNSTIQVDFSSSYDISKQISVYFEALNLNDAIYSTHGRYSNQLLDVVDYGRRFTMGFHAKL